MDQTDILKKYIYEKILNYEYNHSDIISYIKNRNLNYIQNCNGIFLNISNLDYNDLIEIKSLMSSESLSLDIERNIELNELLLSSFKDSYSDFEEKDYQSKNRFKKITINNNKEKDIIRYSRIYNLANELPSRKNK